MDEVDAKKLQRAKARVGEVLRGKWRLDHLLGVGGMASVYAATHRNGKRGAVKMLHLEWIHDEDASGRFLREGYAANTVNHPGVVSVLDDDVAEDGSVFLVMELLEGETVDGRAKSRPGQRLEVPEVIAIADFLLDVLASAHDEGIVHRDIKPANLFVTPQGQLKVLDFGIARLREMSGNSGKMTQTGNAIGTPAFMAREQARGYWSQVDARTDLWAVGATMFTLLTGRQVHQAETVQTLMLAAMTKPAPRICSVVPTLPTMLGSIIDRALAFEQADRWPDARTMQRALRELPGSLAPEPDVLLSVYATRLSTPPSSSFPSSPGSFARGSSQLSPPGMLSLSQATVLPVANERERSGGGKIFAALFVTLAIGGAAAFIVMRSDGVSSALLGRPATTATADAPAPAKPVEPATAVVTPAPEPAPTATAITTGAAPAPSATSAASSKATPTTNGRPVKARAPSPPAAPPKGPPKATPPRTDPLDQF
jgi:serine/threonine protein kinase